MICSPCAAGADLCTEPTATIKAARNLAVRMHGDCHGAPGCACQHQVPPLEVVAARRAAMPRGGLARIFESFTDRVTPPSDIKNLVRVTGVGDAGGCG